MSPLSSASWTWLSYAASFWQKRVSPFMLSLRYQVSSWVSGNTPHLPSEPITSIPLSKPEYSTGFYVVKDPSSLTSTWKMASSCPFMALT